ncbi:MAG: peroxidase-related enzyme [Bacteroidales bacterium]
MSRIKIIDQSQATGSLREIYDELIKSRGQLAGIHQIQSLRPESIRAHMALYMEIMFSRSNLSRAERELIGTVVSVANGCKYCTSHHAEALNHYWKDKDKIEGLINGNYKEILSSREQLLIGFSKHLTMHPSEHEDNDFVEELKEFGLSDAAILDVVLVTAYFNFVNRIVLALGVELEPDRGTGYKY